MTADSFLPPKTTLPRNYPMRNSKLALDTVIVQLHSVPQKGFRARSPMSAHCNIRACLIEEAGGGGARAAVPRAAAARSKAGVPPMAAGADRGPARNLFGSPHRCHHIGWQHRCHPKYFGWQHRAPRAAMGNKHPFQKALSKAMKPSSSEQQDGETTSKQLRRKQPPNNSSRKQR